MGVSAPMSIGKVNGIEAFLFQGNHKPSIPINEQSKMLRTGTIDLVLGPDQYITKDNQVIENFRIEINQLENNVNNICLCLLPCFLEARYLKNVGRWIWPKLEKAQNPTCPKVFRSVSPFLDHITVPGDSQAANHQCSSTFY